MELSAFYMYKGTQLNTQKKALSSVPNKKQTKPNLSAIKKTHFHIFIYKTCSSLARKTF